MRHLSGVSPVVRMSQNHWLESVPCVLFSALTLLSWVSDGRAGRPACKVTTYPKCSVPD